jgi:1,2-diacylglycerol 3-alpha-glucosyltransferase
MNNNNLCHLLILTPGFPENELDTISMPTIQVYVKNLARLYPKLLISIITVWYPFKSRKYKWNGIDIEALGGKYFNRLNYAYTIFKILLRAKSINKLKPVNILHSFHLPLALHGNIVSRFLNIPHVNTILGRDGVAKSKKTKWINLSHLHVVTLSEFHNKSFFNAFNVNANSIIPFGLDTSEFQQIKEEKRTIDILGVGSLYPVKNFSMFIDVISKLVKTYPGLKACIIGEGIEKVLLQKHIDDVGISSNITLTGSLPREDVLIKMLQSRIFLHTSIYESQGYVFYEALYAGCHLVSFNVGVASTIQNWDVCNSENEMIEALKKLLNSKIENKKKVLYSIDETIDKYMSIYKSLT